MAMRRRDVLLGGWPSRSWTMPLSVQKWEPRRHDAMTSPTTPRRHAGISERQRRATDPFWYHTHDEVIAEAATELDALNAWEGVGGKNARGFPKVC